MSLTDLWVRDVMPHVRDTQAVDVVCYRHVHDDGIEHRCHIEDGLLVCDDVNCTKHVQPLADPDEAPSVFDVSQADALIITGHPSVNTLQAIQDAPDLEDAAIIAANAGSLLVVAA